MLAKNMLANYAGQGYTIVVGIVVLPLYLHYMGPEEFGLIGFYTLFSAWLQMLTAGLNPTLARQVAIYRNQKKLESLDFRNILRSIEIVIFLLGLATAICVLLSSSWIAQTWLSAEKLEKSVLTYSVGAMGVVAALRWGVSLYSSGMAGMEQQLWLNGFNVGVVTLRNVGGLLLVIFVSPKIEVYFTFQAALSVIELLAIGMVFYSRQPEAGRVNDPGLRFSWCSLRQILPFTLATAYTSLIWTFVTQFDKLLLSNFLTLELFGYFSFAVLLSNGVLRIVEPINQAVLPRLTGLVANGEVEAVRDLYKKTSQLLAFVSLGTSGVIAAFSSQVLYILSGNQALTEYSASVLFWFTLGNGILVLSSLLFTLQAAFGQLRLHVYNGTISGLIQVPLLAYVAIHFGVHALAITWFILRLVMFAVMSPIVHVKFQQGPYTDWLLGCIGKPLLGTLTGVALSLALDSLVFHSAEFSHRGYMLGVLLIYSVIIFMVSAAISSEVRVILVTLWQQQLQARLLVIKNRTTS
jgi:O-antigen/teichoic acid export membrane protein